jgi:hypothetical protein
LAPFCSAVVRPLGVAYRSDGVLLEIAATLGLVELEFPPSMRRAPSGLSGVFTRSFGTPADRDVTQRLKLKLKGCITLRNHNY